jgi:hypothetical protein
MNKKVPIALALLGMLPDMDGLGADALPELDGPFRMPEPEQAKPQVLIVDAGSLSGGRALALHQALAGHEIAGLLLEQEQTSKQTSGYYDPGLLDIDLVHEPKIERALARQLPNRWADPTYVDPSAHAGETPAEKHARATKGEIPMEGPGCAMCGLCFTTRRPGCHDYKNRHVHVWCEEREPTKTRLAAIEVVYKMLGEDKSSFVGDDEARRASATRLLEEASELQLEQLLSKHADGLVRRTKAEIKRARRAAIRAKAQRETKR